MRYLVIIIIILPLPLLLLLPLPVPHTSFQTIARILQVILINSQTDNGEEDEDFVDPAVFKKRQPNTTAKTVSWRPNREGTIILCVSLCVCVCVVGELVREMSQLALQGEREKPPSTINRTADNLPHLPSIATSSTTYHTTRNCSEFSNGHDIIHFWSVFFPLGSQVPQLPPISIGHAPCLTGSGGRAQGRPHCACCGKKTGLASTYTCR